MVGGSRLGANLNWEDDRVEDHPFTDLVRTTRGFYNLAGRLASNGKMALANTDANGWPTEDFAFSVADNSEYGNPIPTGVYHMAFTGPAGVQPMIRADVPAGAAAIPAGAALPTLKFISFDAASGQYIYDVTVPAGVLAMSFDFHATQGQVKNIKVLQPGYSLASYPTFSNEFLNLLKNLNPAVLRLKDFTHTDNNPVVNWADRTKVTDATQGRVAVAGDLQPSKGIAWEYAIQLANALNEDVWVSVPAHASDDYVKQLATLLKNSLNSKLNIYLEYSNEVWNGSYEQFTYNLNAATSEVIAAAKAGTHTDLNYDNLPVDLSNSNGGAYAYIWAERRTARRLYQITNIFNTVWTSAGLPSPINNRVRAILSSQVAVPSRYTDMLTYMNAVYGPPKNYFFGIGVAPYANFGGLQNSTTATKDDLIAALSSSVDFWATKSTLGSLKATADSYGLKLEAYEMGIDTYGPANIANKAAAMVDPRVQAIMQRFLTNWYALGGGLTNWVTLGARSYNSPYGTWSITNDIHNFNEPKELAFKTVRGEGLGVGA